jgi:23S rRNA (adenine2503-C2)-methyltransferase
VDWFFEFDRDGLVAWCADRGMPRHAAGQLLDWVYRKGVVDPASMTNLSKAHRELLSHEMGFLQGAVAADQVATDGTRKLLVDWDAAGGAIQETGESTDVAPAPDARSVALPQATASASPRAVARGRATECVMIPTADRHTACISSQIGCPVGCRFCASGIGGLEGNLTTGRILEQVFLLSRIEGVGRISHVVFMGMGEPLANLPAVTGAIRALNAEWGFGISARRITVSTVGLPAAIRKFCDFDLPVTLALSLHAPNDELRRSIIPWADYSTIDELLDACDEWFRRTGREITLEYILLGGLNDRAEHAQELASHARRLRANVNLIRYNEVRGLPYARPSTDDVLAFQAALRERGVNAHIRASRGRDIAAACGQLRHERIAP